MDTSVVSVSSFTVVLVHAAKLMPAIRINKVFLIIRISFSDEYKYVVESKDNTILINDSSNK